MAGLLEKSQVGKREDLSDLVSIADAASTPFTTMAPKGKSLGNTKFEWQVDAYAAATTTPAVDGTDVADSAKSDVEAPLTAATNPAANRVRISNYGQYFRRAFRISTLSEDVSKVAGVSSEIASGIAKKTVELKRDMELSFLSSQYGRVDTGAVGYLTRGLGRWTNPSVAYNATSGATNDNTWDDNWNSYRIPSASVNTAATSANLSDDNVQAILASIFSQTGQIGSFDMICGSTLRRAMSKLVNTSTVSNTATNQSGITSTVVRMLNSENETTLTSTIDIFRGDFGTVRIHPDKFIGAAGAGTDTVSLLAGFIIPMDMVEVRYGILPRTKSLTNNGGGEGRYLEAFAGLCVKNPLGFGKIVLAS